MKLFRIIGYNIKSSLALNRMTIDDFAEALQTDVGTVHKIMDGRKTLNEGELNKIVSVLKCTSEDLLQERPEGFCLSGAQFRGEFKEAAHMETFLNLVDAYMDCKELSERME